MPQRTQTIQRRRIMKTLHLERNPNPAQTDGILTMPSGREFYTLEQAWRNNRPFDSCIPDGVYLIEPYKSPKFGDVYILSGGTVSKFKSPHHQRQAWREEIRALEARIEALKVK